MTPPLGITLVLVIALGLGSTPVACSAGRYRASTALRRAPDEPRPDPRRSGPGLDEILQPSLRGEDEIAEAPASLRRPRLPYSWEAAAHARGRVLVGWEKHSESLGRPNAGKLRDGAELPRRGPGFVHRPSHSFGTDELLAAIGWALDRVLRQFPDTVPVFIGDLSAQGGGAAPPHHSHQSGRDVDIGYYLAHNEPAGRFIRVDAESLDVEKSWALLEGFLTTGMVRYIFVDYSLQEPLYEQAREVGWSEAALGEVFQYPRGRGVAHGVIRHARGHADHFHLRIRCPIEDRDCVD